MKIVTKSNFDEELFVEVVIAENVNEYFGKQMVDLWNEKHWDERSSEYLKLVEDDYVVYDGYKEIYGDV